MRPSPAVRVGASVWMCALICGAAIAAEPLALHATATTSKEPLVLRVATVGADGAESPRPWPVASPGANPGANPGASPGASQVSWLFVRVSGTQENRDASTIGQPDADGALRIMPGAAGTALVGMDLAMIDQQWSAAEANAFASRCGQDELCFKEPARVRYAVSAATVVQVAAEPGEESTNHAAMSKSGLASEIRPLMDPLHVQGGDCAFRVYVGGDAVPGGVVRAVHVQSGAVQRVRADAKGIVVFNVDASGAWRVECDVLLERGGEWQATSSVLTFTALGNGGIDAAAMAQPRSEVQP